jgi:hypothetical protein
MSSDITPRNGMAPVGRRVRAYIAPVDRVSERPAIFDPAKHGCFPLDGPPSPWIDVGWIENFQRASTSVIDEVRTGPQGSISVQFRRTIGASVELDFCDWGKLQMAISAGTQHMNVLAVDPNSEEEPMGGTPLAPFAVLPGSTVQEIVLGPGAVDSFTIGDLVAVDVDYEQQVGYVGTGIAAAYISDPADIFSDVNYVRRVTFNVGCVKEKTATSLLLSQPMPGGAPVAMSGVQKVVGFVDRDGGNFLQEWSALFVAGEESGGRICYYYPRLRPSRSLGSTGKGAVGNIPESQHTLIGTLSRVALHGTFVALPWRDGMDNEQIVCYRSYFPARFSPLY